MKIIQRGPGSVVAAYYSHMLSKATSALGNTSSNDRHEALMAFVVKRRNCRLAQYGVRNCASLGGGHTLF
jgi:hypothetical protein